MNRLEPSGNTAPNSLPEKSAYEDSLVICLDVLGFSDRVLEKKDDPASIERVLDTLSTFRGPDHGAVAQWRFWNFSDTAVLRVPLGNRSAEDAWLQIDYALGWAAWKQRQLLMEHQLMIRGGAARGPSLVSNSGPYGPAVVRAAELESQKAHLPRVVLDEPAVPPAWMRDFNAGDTTWVVCLNDKVWFLDYLMESAIAQDEFVYVGPDGRERPVRIPELDKRMHEARVRTRNRLQAHRKAILEYARRVGEPKELARVAWTCFFHNFWVHRVLDSITWEQSDSDRSALEQMLIPESELADHLCTWGCSGQVASTVFVGRDIRS